MDKHLHKKGINIHECKEICKGDGTYRICYCCTTYTPINSNQLQISGVDVAKTIQYVVIYL